MGQDGGPDSPDTVFRGIKQVDKHFKLTMTASNIMRTAARILFEGQQGALQ
jgi:hypothetical protein